jgi:hemerythrin
MPLLQWKENYSVHFETLDDHHKHFIGIINRLYDSMMSTNDIGSVHPIVCELVEYSSYHFTAEEAFMKDNGYGELDRHISKHRYFSEKIMQMKEMERDNQLAVARDLTVFLGDWLLHHILEEDKRYSNTQPAQSHSQ